MYWAFLVMGAYSWCVDEVNVTTENLEKPTAQASLAPASLALHEQSCVSRRNICSARYGFSRPPTVRESAHARQKLFRWQAARQWEKAKKQQGEKLDKRCFLRIFRRGLALVIAMYGLRPMRRHKMIMTMILSTLSF